jgi:hypothetical protein
MEPTSHSCKTMLVLLCLLTWPNIADPHSYLDLHRSGIDDMVDHMLAFMALNGHRMVETNMFK